MASFISATVPLANWILSRVRASTLSFWSYFRSNQLDRTSSLLEFFHSAEVIILEDSISFLLVNIVMSWLVYCSFTDNPLLSMLVLKSLSSHSRRVRKKTAIASFGAKAGTCVTVFCLELHYLLLSPLFAIPQFSIIKQFDMITNLVQ